MPRLGLAALALLAIVGIAAYVLMPSDEKEPLTSGQDSTVASEEERAPVVADTTPAPEMDTAPAQRETVEPEQAAKAASPGGFESYENADGALVRVVDKESGEPVAGAEVLLVVRDELEESQLEMAMLSGGSDLRQILKQFGHRYKTGADGTVRTRPFTDYPILLATHNGSSGFNWQSEPGTREVEIAIEPEVIVTVQVVDSDGQAVPNAPVALMMQQERFTFTMFTRDTDSDGVLVLDDLKPYLESIGDRDGSSLAVSLATMTAKEDLTETQRVTLNDEVRASGKVELVMPATGQVTVQVVSSDGSPYEGMAMVNLRSDSETSQFGRQSDGVMRPVVDGSATFYHVALGRELVATLHTTEGNSIESTELHGPTQEGERIEVKIERPDYPRVRVQLVDGDGRPYADQRVHLAISIEHENGSQEHDRTEKSDAEGALSFELEARPADQLNYQRSARFMIKHEDGRESSAKLDLSQALSVGVTDFGMVALEADPVLLQGRVLDSAGEPIVAARMEIRSRRLDRDGHPSGWSSTRVHTSTGADGAFLLIGELPDSPEYAVRIMAEGYQEFEEPVQIAGQTVEFRLDAGTFLAGRMLFDAEVDPFSMSVRLHDPEGGTTWCSMQQDHQSEQHEVEFKSALKPGIEYRLEVQTSAGEVVYELPGLYVTAGTTTEPPGLQPLDLRGAVRTIELKVFGADGRPLDASMIVRSANDEWRSFSAVEGLFEVQIVDEIHELTVQHPEHASKTLTGVRTDQTLRLDAGLEATLILPSELLGIEENVSYNVQLYPESEGGHRHYLAGSRVEFESNGQAKIFVPGPAEYRVSIGIFHADGNTHRSSSFTTGSIQISSNGSVHNLQVDRERFDRTLNRLLDRD